MSKDKLPLYVAFWVQHSCFRGLCLQLVGAAWRVSVVAAKTHGFANVADKEHFFYTNKS
jgi:hypothetical protein